MANNKCIAVNKSILKQEVYNLLIGAIELRFNDINAEYYLYEALRYKEVITEILETIEYIKN